jgi:A/G-specific adenine glycosylase
LCLLPGIHQCLQSIRMTAAPNISPEPIRAQLLAWFAAHGRDLPWRQTRNPYRIMVSEIMLQQTQVERVIPKYHAFLAAFPTLAELAQASTAEVIRMWAGLGYNRRAVNLQRAARVIVEQHGGQFPHDVAALRGLPGIGPYTAGAIACFAFEQDVAFMDTNIRRVVQRVCFSDAAPASERDLHAAAKVLVPPGAGWAWNQAIMELGALICTAASPACWRCPLRDQCRDYAARQAEDAQALDQLALGVAVAPARMPRRVAEKREGPFVGSSRYYRGRVIAALRAAHDGLGLGELGPLVKDDYSGADAEWLEQLVAGLARDALLVYDAGRVRLPE